MSDTPETEDADWVEYHGSIFVDIHFARRLERERDEARKEAAMWKSNHDNQVALKSAIIQRPDLKDRAERVQKLMAERDSLRAINAELEGAFQNLMEEYDDRKCQFGDDYLWQKHEDEDAVNAARSALAKSKQSKK